MSPALVEEFSPYFPSGRLKRVFYLIIFKHRLKLLETHTWLSPDFRFVMGFLMREKLHEWPLHYVKQSSSLRSDIDQRNNSNYVLGFTLVITTALKTLSSVH